MPARSRRGRWACSCFRVSRVRRCSRRYLRRAGCRRWRLASSEPLCWAGRSSRTSGPARPMGRPPARQPSQPGATVIAVVLAHSRWPALFLAGVAGVVVGALVLGAAGEVRIVVVAAAVCAALTLGWIERSHRNWTAPPRRGIALVLLSLLAGAAATGAVLLQAQEDPRDPALVAQGRQYPGIKPAWTDPLGTASNSLDEPAARARLRSQRHLADASEPAAKRPPRSTEHPSRSIWLYVVAAIAARSCSSSPRCSRRACSPRDSHGGGCGAGWRPARLPTRSLVLGHGRECGWKRAGCRWP